MLKTNSKQVQTAVRNHILNNFLPENYGNDKPAIENLRDQINYMRHAGDSIYETAVRYVEGGSLLVYYYDQRLFLQTVLEQSNDEAARYDDDQVWKTYIHLVAMAMTDLYEGVK